MATETKKLEVKTTVHVYRDTLDKIRMLASFDTRETGKITTPADYLKWMIDKAYESKQYHNRKRIN